MKALSEETREKCRQLRADGMSYGKIAKQLGIGKATAERYCADMPKPAGSPGQDAAAVPAVGKDRVPGASKIPMSSEAVEKVNRIRELQLESELLTAQINNRQARQKMQLLDKADELDIREREAALREKEAQIAYANRPPDADPAQQARLAEVMRAAEAERQAAAAERAQFIEQRHALEIQQVTDKITALQVQIANANRTGKTEFDLLSELLTAAVSEARGFRQDATAFVMSQYNRGKFDPNRVPPELGRQHGETLVARIENKPLRQLACPGCGSVFECSQEFIDKFKTVQCDSCYQVFPVPANLKAPRTTTVPAPNNNPAGTSQKLIDSSSGG